jgi:type IV pilus assembly protein PilX
MRTRQDGITLLLTILLLLGVLILGASAAKLALSGERAARAERDRHIAFEAAEEALMDAERDIEGKAGAGAARQALFDAAHPDGFAPGCGSGDAAGLCAAADGGPPAWQAVDIAGGPSAVHGQFTGADMQTGQGPLPLRRPRYIVERLQYRAPGAAADAAPSYYYRVTVMGFGAREGTEVVLQSTYRRSGDE